MLGTQTSTQPSNSLPLSLSPSLPFQWPMSRFVIKMLGTQAITKPKRAHVPRVQNSFHASTTKLDDWEMKLRELTRNTGSASPQDKLDFYLMFQQIHA